MGEPLTVILAAGGSPVAFTGVFSANYAELLGGLVPGFEAITPGVRAMHDELAGVCVGDVLKRGSAEYRIATKPKANAPAGDVVMRLEIAA